MIVNDGLIVFVEFCSVTGNDYCYFFSDGFINVQKKKEKKKERAWSGGMENRKSHYLWLQRLTLCYGGEDNIGTSVSARFVNLICNEGRFFFIFLMQFSREN